MRNKRRSFDIKMDFGYVWADKYFPIDILLGLLANVQEVWLKSGSQITPWLASHIHTAFCYFTNLTRFVHVWRRMDIEYSQ